MMSSQPDCNERRQVIYEYPKPQDGIVFACLVIEPDMSSASGASAGVACEVSNRASDFETLNFASREGRNNNNTSRA